MDGQDIGAGGGFGEHAAALSDFESGKITGCCGRSGTGTVGIDSC